MSKKNTGKKLLSAWIDRTKKTIECIGLVENIEIRFTAAKVGSPDANGYCYESVEALEPLLAKIKEQIKRETS